MWAAEPEISSFSPAAETESPGAVQPVIVCPHCPGGTGYWVGGAETQDLPPVRKGVLEWLPGGLPASSLLPALPSRGTMPVPMNVGALWCLRRLAPAQQRIPSKREGGKGVGPGWQNVSCEQSKEGNEAVVQGEGWLSWHVNPAQP